MAQLSATKCSCIATLWASLVSFAAITLCVASQRVFVFVIVYFVMTQSGNFWIHHRILRNTLYGSYSSSILASLPSLTLFYKQKRQRALQTVVFQLALNLPKL
jgi:hypothetical protein